MNIHPLLSLLDCRNAMVSGRWGKRTAVPPSHPIDAMWKGSIPTHRAGLTIFLHSTFYGRGECISVKRCQVTSAAQHMNFSGVNAWNLKWRCA